MSNMIHIAANNLGNATHHHRRMADQCAALATLLRSIDSQPAEPMPVEELAKALLPLDLCIVHRHTLRDAIGALKGEDDGLDHDEFHALIDRLNLALEAHAQ